MLSASTSIPSASISWMRSETLDHSRPGASSGWLITAAASGTMVWAWTSTVLTRLPLPTPSRRRPCPGPGVCRGVAFPRLHPTKARPANAPAISSPEIGISVLLVNARCYSAVAMCGRFYLTASPAEIRKLFKLEKIPELVPRYNIAPMQSTPIVVAEENGRAVMMARPLPRCRDDQCSGRDPRRQARLPDGLPIATLSGAGERLLRVASQGHKEAALQDHAAPRRADRVCRIVGALGAGGR